MQVLLLLPWLSGALRRTSFLTLLCSRCSGLVVLLRPLLDSWRIEQSHQVFSSSSRMRRVLRLRRWCVWMELLLHLQPSTRALCSLPSHARPLLTRTRPPW